jgi:hypothetical protein
MPGNQDFEIQIAADVSQFVGGMQEASEATDELKGHLAGIGEAGAGAEGGFASLGEAMSEWHEHANEGVETLGKMACGWEGLLSVIGGAIAELDRETDCQIGKGD